MSRARMLIPLLAATMVLASPALQEREDSEELLGHNGQPPINLLGYIPNVPVNIVGLAVYTIIAVVQTIHHFRKGAKYMLAMTIGLWFYALGIVMRFVIRGNPTSLIIFIISNLCVILAPCAFIGSLYALVGNTSRRLGTADFLPVRAEKIAVYFVWSDVITFLIQGGGGGMEVNVKLANTGAHIFLAGLILQIISFGLFVLVTIVWALRVRSRAPHIWANHSWRPLLPAIIASCFFIIVRSIFRIIENSQGFHGFLSIHEVYFYCLDALPLAIATTVFAIMWPENYLPRDGKRAVMLNEVELKERGASP